MNTQEHIHAFVDEALGNTSYFVEIGSGAAVVVDPRRDIDGYIERAERRSLRIVAILETHLHADFVSGARELIEATGARLYAAKEADLQFEHTPISPSDRLVLGDVSVEVIATPGHTPEHLAFFLRSSDGVAAFTGGALISGGAARTDLTGVERTEELAQAQFASAHRLAQLPAQTLLCPTHGEGSFCSATPGTSEPGTIGEERATNPMLAVEDAGPIVRRFIAGFGSYPPYFKHLRSANRAGTSLLRELEDPSHLDGSGARASVDRGAWLIDARPVDEWARVHPAGAISIELRPAFASWLGWVVPFGEPVVFVIEPGQLEGAVRLARRIGYDRLEGWTTIDDWRRANGPTTDALMIAATDAHARTERALLDVRQASEYSVSHLPGAQHIELGEIVAGRIPEAKDVIAYCGHGERSATAVSLLARHGIRVANLAGGMNAWRNAGLPVT